MNYVRSPLLRSFLFAVACGVLVGATIDGFAGAFSVHGDRSSAPGNAQASVRRL